jgi:multisubunit Na+/H+ antiporter MnhG subunit
MILLGLASIVNLVCVIIVLTKLFPAKGVFWGLFGIICGIYTFIWGWQNAERAKIKNVMIVWTIGIIATIILRLLGRAVGG